MTRINIGIVNITGYIGIELARILMCHPDVKITSITGRSSIGQKVAEVFPHLYNLDLTISSELDDVDIAFSALPHKVSAETVLNLVNRDIKVIDASADFRLKNPALYPVWYQFDHPSHELLAEAVYGLPELHRSEIPAARLIANPGCYPTSAILALAPAMKEGILEGHLVIDSKSGVSGAGRSPTLKTHFSEVNESVSAYALSGHRHLPEIVQELEIIADINPQTLTFVPHLVPMTRGMLSSCYGRLKQGILPLNDKGVKELLALYRSYYQLHPFVKVLDYPPSTKHTWGTNLCLIYPTIDINTGTLIIISCLDNLIKGGAGQAVQNMNLLLGAPETTGLDSIAIYP